MTDGARQAGAPGNLAPGNRAPGNLAPGNLAPGNFAQGLALAGFLAVAVAQVTNMILSRAVAGSVPPFTLAFMRWLIVAAGLLGLAWTELRGAGGQIRARLGWILAAGFLGMFLCGGPIYIAGVSTSAINIALIMALSPIVVMLVSWRAGLERIGAMQALGLVLALGGVLVVISRGDPRALLAMRAVGGDLWVLLAMLGWSGYTLLQSRAAPGLSFLARVCLFSAAGAAFSLPFALLEIAPLRNTGPGMTDGAAWTRQAAQYYLFAGLVPGILAYAGFAWLGGRYGSVRTSLILYIGPVASAILSFLVLGEPPAAIQYLGGAFILAGIWCSLRRKPG